MILHNSGSVLSRWQRKQKGQYAVQPTMPSEWVLILFMLLIRDCSSPQESRAVWTT